MKTIKIYLKVHSFVVANHLPFMLTRSFSMHPFSTHSKYHMFSGGRERVHWEQMGYYMIVEYLTFRFQIFNFYKIFFISLPLIITAFNNAFNTRKC